MINVFLVDDHELVRTGIRRILEDVRGIKVVGEAQSGETAVAFCRQHHPDVILMDMNMPGIGGLEATRKILRIRPDVRIIVLTIHSENPFPTKVMQAGAAGYLTKGAAPDEMIHAIRLVHSGQRYISPEIAQQMALSQFASADENPFKSLSERELQVFLRLAKGETIGQMAESMSLSVKTVSTYRTRLLEKLGVGSNAELATYALRHGLIVD